MPESPFYAFDAPRNGAADSMAAYRGKVVLIVNVASRCGFTPQYEGLEALHRAHADRGLAVLAFPCNQFGAQEPGSREDIAAFCATNYGVSFPIYDKVAVNGPGALALYDWLKGAKPGFAGTRSIKWNFTKFLLDRDGKVKARFSPRTPPEAIERDILRLL